MTTDTDVAEAERLHGLATKGPWVATFDEATKIKDASGNSLLIMMQTHLYGIRPMDEVNRTANSIAALHNIAPALFAAYRERERLRKALEKAAEQFEFYAKEHHTKANNLAGRGFVADSDASIKKALTNEKYAEICRRALSTEER